MERIYIIKMKRGDWYKLVPATIARGQQDAMGEEIRTRLQEGNPIDLEYKRAIRVSNKTAQEVVDAVHGEMREAMTNGWLNYKINAISKKIKDNL